MDAQELERELTDDKYEEFLDEVYGEVSVCGITFDAGRILRKLDPIAFRCGKNDYESMLDPIWVCGECGEEYDEEWEAEDCCND